jgi:hypothetical protein
VSGSKDSAIPAGFLADWPDTEAVGPFAGGSDARGPEARGPDWTAADMPSGWGDWGTSSPESGD